MSNEFRRDFYGELLLQYRIHRSTSGVSMAKQIRQTKQSPDSRRRRSDRKLLRGSRRLASTKVWYEGELFFFILFLFFCFRFDFTGTFQLRPQSVVADILTDIYTFFVHSRTPINLENFFFNIKKIFITQI